MIVTTQEQQEFKRELQNTEDPNELYELEDSLQDHVDILRDIAGEIQYDAEDLHNTFNGVFGDALAGSYLAADDAAEELYSASDELERLLELVEDRIHEVER